MREKEGFIPKELSDCTLTAIETLSHGFVCKPVYLRRYRCSNICQHLSNKYDVTFKDVKMVPELVFESHPINIATVARMFDIKPQTLQYWHKR